MSRIRPIVLAAGRGRRLHPDTVKANIELAGDTLLGHVLSTIGRATRDGASLAAPVVVIGARAAAVVARHGERAAHWVVNDAWHASDMAASLRLGIASSAGPGDDDPVLVWPVDCPLVSPRTVMALCAAIEGGFWSGAIPTRGTATGHPVVLGPQLWHALLHGEQPHLRALLTEHHARVRRVEADDPAVLDNLNTPAALEAAARRTTS